jgi:hypothetical protein
MSQETVAAAATLSRATAWSRLRERVRGGTRGDKRGQLEKDLKRDLKREGSLLTIKK